MKLVVKNFQSIESAVLECHGFTVVTGPTNLGKSALVRAASGALFGIAGDHFIRDGEVQCGVGLALDQLIIRWKKVKSGKATPGRETSLDINGQLHTKLGRDHAALIEPHGVKEIRTTADKIRPQVASQHDNIFLVMENDSTVAEVLRVVGRSDVITEAQRLSKKDLRDTEGRLKIRTVDRDKAKEFWEELNYVPVVRREYTALVGGVGAIGTQVKERVSLQERIQRYQDLAPRVIPDSPPTPVIPEAVALLSTVRRVIDLAPREIPAEVVLVSEQGRITLLEQIRRAVELEPREVPDQPTLPDIRVKSEVLDKVRITKRVQGDLDKVNMDLIGVNTQILDLEKRKVTLEETLGVCPSCGRGFDGHDHQTS